jgi:hypothetical protein
MKTTLILASVLGLWAMAEAKEGNHKMGLPHFDRKQLPKKMQLMMLPETAFPEGEEGCPEADVKLCTRCTHAHAMKCAMMMHQNAEYQTKVAECEAEDPEGFKGRDEAWQTASTRWHKALGDCLAEDRPDSPAQDSMFLFRKKRSHHEHKDPAKLYEMVAKGCEEIPDTYDAEDVDSIEQCWKDMRHCHHTCAAKIKECPKLAGCHGYGPVPEDVNEAAWYNFVKEIRLAKIEAVVAHKHGVLRCMGKLPEDVTTDAFRTMLYGEIE